MASLLTFVRSSVNASLVPRQWRAGILLATALGVAQVSSAAVLVSSVAPHGGQEGATVTLTGSGFTGASVVAFGATNAVSYTVVSDTQITATAPVGFATAQVSVTSPSGSGTSSELFVRRSGPVTLVGPVTPPPLGTTLVSTPGNADAIGRNTGRNWAFSGTALSGRTYTYWGAMPNGVKESFDGNSFTTTPYSEILAYQAGLSNLPAGVVVYTGETRIPDAPGTPILTRFTMTYSKPLLSAASLGLPASVGAVVFVAPGASFTENMRFDACWASGCGFIPALDFYDSQSLANATAYSSFDGGFYYENTPPELGTIPPQSVTEGQATAALPLSVYDAETGAGAVSFTATSSNTGVIPNANIAIGGSGANRSVTVTSVLGQVGTTQITITANDGVTTSTSVFDVTVVPANTPPTIGDVVDQLIQRNGVTGALAFTVGDAETAPASLLLSGASSDTTLLPVANIVFGGSGANRTVTLTPAAGQSGSTTVTITVSDGSLTASDTFVLRVNAPPLLVNNANNVPRGGSVAITTADLDATDDSTPQASLVFTLGSGGNGGPPHAGTLFKNNVAMAEADTFTRDDIAQGRLRYDHNGNCETSDSFQFTVQDADGGVIPVPPGPPFVFSHGIIIVLPQTAPTPQPATFSVGLGATHSGVLQATDTDCAPQTITYQIAVAPTKGTLTAFDGATGAFAYQATLGQTGPDSFSFTATSTEDAQTSALALVSIAIQNQPPTATPQSITVGEGGNASGTLGAHDDDLPAQALTFAISTPPARGTLTSFNPTSGAFTYAPNPGAIGLDQFSFTASDGSLTSAPATVSIRIRPKIDVGSIVFTDNNGSQHRIWLYDPATAQLALVSDDPLLSVELHGVATAPDGSLVVVGSANPGSTAHLWRVDASNGAATELASWNGAFPLGIAVADDGRVFVADAIAGLRRFNADGSGQTGIGLGQPAAPAGIAIGSGGEIFLTDVAQVFGAGAHNRVWRLNADGSNPQVLAEDGELKVPLGLDIADNGRLAVSNAGGFVGQANSVVLVDTVTGNQTLLATGAPMGTATGVAHGGGSTLYVASQSNASLIGVDTGSGAQNVLISGSPLSQPFGISAVRMRAGNSVLNQTVFEYTNADHVLAAHLVEEPGVVCAVNPPSVRSVGLHSVQIQACTGALHAALAQTVTVTVGVSKTVRRIHADNSGEAFYASVDAALADPTTVTGDTIELAPGTYPAPIMLTKSVHLVGGAGFTPLVVGPTTPPATVIDGGGSAAYGIVVNPGVTNASISGLEVRNVTQHCITANGGNDGLSVTQSVIHGCGGRGISVAGGAVSGINNVTIDHNEVYATGDRGIVVWDGIKRDITITNNWVHNLTGCCGIELQDGAATGAVVTDNLVENTGDSGMAFIQLTSGSPSLRANVIARNTVSNTGRFGIEIKIPNGSGAASGDGAIIVEDNIVTSPGAVNLSDRAGIAVMRRSWGSYPAYQVDTTRGVIVRNNQVSGFRTTNTAQYEGYGIVVEGLGSTVSGNTLNNNDVGLQVQQGNPNGLPPGDSDQNAVSDWFGRGNAPYTCVGVASNTIGGSTLAAQRQVPASASMIGSRVLNQNTGARYCSINSAIATATPGDVLIADASTYAENVVIDKAIVLRGAKVGVNAGVGSTRDPSSGESIIVPATIEPGISLSSSGQAVIEIAANDVIVDGFVIDGDNPALTSPVALNGANPDASAGVYAIGNRIRLQNLILRNLVYVGIDGYATGTPSGDNHIVNNRFGNITAPSLWGIGVVLQDNFYAEVAGNLMDQVRVGVQTNNNSAAAPGGFAPTIVGNEIHATRTAIFHNLFYGSASAYTISGNGLLAAPNAAQAGGWKGLWLESMGSAQTVTIAGNTVDGSALFGSGRSTTGYVLNNVTSTAPTAAIDGGSVAHVDVGVLSTDATGYTGPVNDFIVRNVAFNDIGIGALYVEDTQEQAGSAKLTVGSGNTYTASVAHTLALSGAAPVVGHGGGAIPNVFVRSARFFFNGTPSNGPCTPTACSVVSALVNDGVAAVDTGGIVDLEGGTFAQNVVLGKSVTLRGPKQGVAGYAAGRGTGESIIAPASGVGITYAAADVVVDGVSVENVAAHGVQRQAGDPADRLRFANSRVVGISNGSGIFSEPGATGSGDGFLIERNLFSNITGSGAQNGRGIVLFKGTRNAQVLDNRFEGIQQYALQANGGSGTVEQLTVTGNVSAAMAPITSATSFIITGTTGVTFRRNTVNGTAGGLFLSDRTTDFEASCNRLVATGSAISTSDFFGSAPNANVRIFHNALSGGTWDLSSQMAQGLAVGSNWYDGTAPGVDGASVALSVADPLPADPTNGGAFDVAACGNNAPTQLVAQGGSGQSTPVTTAFALPLRARVVDALGGAVAGQPIALTAPAPSGASAVLGTPSGSSNFNGELVSSATANGRAGSYAVGADSGALHASFALTNQQGIGTVVFDNTSLVYTGSAQTLLAHVAQDPTATCTLTPPNVTNAGSYPVSATCAGNDYNASGSTTVVVAKATGTITFDPLTYTGSSQTVTAHITQEPATSCTGTPATVGPGAGSYPVSASCVGTNYDASGVGVVVIAKAASTITINSADLHQNYGSTHAVGASASPISSGHVDVTYDGNAAVPSAVGSYSVLATLVDPNYQAAPASAVLVIADAANITLTVASSQTMALVGSGAPYTGFVDYTGTLRNVGAPTGQNVHTVIHVVRIDDGNTLGENPIAIDALDVEACLYDPSGWAAQEPGNHHGCPQDYESLVFSQGSGAYNGRPAVTFRYPINPGNDAPLPHIDPAVATPPAKFRFKRGDYQVHVSLVGTDGTVYAHAFDGTTVPEASIAYTGATSGQAEDALLSTTRLRNTGGRVDGNVIVRVTLSDVASSSGSPMPLATGDAEFAYQVGDTYFTLPWAGAAADGGLVTYFGPGSGFPLEDGYDATTAGRGIFHRQGSYRLTYEVLDADTLTVQFASSVTAPITIGPNMVNFALSDLAQVYNGTPRAVTVTPNGVPHQTVYEPLAGASCPASPSGSNTTPPTNAGTYCVYVAATGSYQGSAQGTLVVAKAAAVVALTDDDGTADGVVHRSFNAAAQVVGATSTPTVASIVVTYDGSPTAPSATGTYGLVATVVDPNYSGQVTGTLIVAANGGASILLNAGTLNATWNGSPHAVTATTTPGGIAYAVSYVGDGATVYPPSATPPSAVGQYHVVATTTDANYAPVSASGTLVIASAGAGIVLDAPTLTATWSGNPHAVTATTTPGGLAYGVTYNGLLDPPSAVGSYAIVATITDPNHVAAQATGTLVISAAGASITLDAPTLSATYDAQPHVVTATTAPAGLAYSVTYAGSPTPPVNAGSYAVVATITAPGRSGSVSGTLVIAKATGLVTFSATNATFDGTGHVISAVISQEPADTAACVLTTTGEYPRINAGTTTLGASCHGTNYDAFGSSTLVVSPKPVTIGLSGLGSFPYDGNTHAATATVAGTVAGFPAGTVVAYNPGGATAPSAVGSYDVTATLAAASTNYTAPAANGTILIGAANAGVTLGGLAQVYDGTPRVATATTSPTGLALAITYDGSATPPVNAGSYTVVATITTPGYSGSASGTLVVARAAATVTLSNLTQAWDGTPRAVTVTTTPSGLATSVTYDSGATVPSAIGAYSVVATVTDPNYVGTANGTLHIVNGAANAIAANGGTTFSGTAGQPLAGALPSVKVTDAGGNPVAGVAVTFATAGAGNGTLSGAAQSTDQNGIATLGGWTLDAAPGTDTVKATAAGVAGEVEFIATSTADGSALAVTITDARSYTQIGRTLTYTITVGNTGSSDLSGVHVVDALPAELGAAHWQCIVIAGASCPVASGNGDLDQTLALPAHGSLAFLLTAVVMDDIDGTIANSVEATSGSNTVTRTDNTEIVIFRDGFELGGDGSESWPVGARTAQIGALGEVDALFVTVQAAQLVALHPAVIAQATDGAFRVEAMRIGGAVYVRLVARTVQGEGATDWSAIDGDRIALILDGSRLELVGAATNLGLTLAKGGTFTVSAVTLH